MNAPMNSPLRGRPLAIAMTCLMALAISLTAHRPTEFEGWAFGIGLFTALIFWIQCFEFEE